MKKEKKFSINAVLALVTGKGMGAKFSEVHEAAELVPGHGVWTHEFAEEGVWARLREAVLDQYPSLVEYGLEEGDEAAGVDVQKAMTEFGAVLSLRQGDQERVEHPLASLERIAGDKPVVVVEVDER